LALQLLPRDAFLAFDGEPGLRLVALAVFLGGCRDRGGFLRFHAKRLLLDLHVRLAHARFHRLARFQRGALRVGAGGRVSASDDSMRARAVLSSALTTPISSTARRGLQEEGLGLLGHGLAHDLGLAALAFQLVRHVPERGLHFGPAAALRGQLLFERGGGGAALGFVGGARVALAFNPCRASSSRALSFSASVQSRARRPSASLSCSAEAFSRKASCSDT